MGEMVKSFPTERTDVTPSRRGSQSSGAKASETAAQLGNEAKQVVSQVADQAKDLVSHRVTERASRSAEDIDHVARALRRTRQDLGESTAAPYVDKAADQLERFSRFLRDANPADVVRDVERFARREPLLFLGGAFALGLLGARFLKSSAHHDEVSWSRDDDGDARFQRGVGYRGRDDEDRTGQYGRGSQYGARGDQVREGRSASQGYGARGSFVQRGMQEGWTKNQGQRAGSQGAPGYEGQAYSSTATPQPGQGSAGTNWHGGSATPEQPAAAPGEDKNARSGGAT